METGPSFSLPVASLPDGCLAGFIMNSIISGEQEQKKIATPAQRSLKQFFLDSTYQYARPRGHLLAFFSDSSMGQ